MIKEIFYIIVVSWCFIVMITIKICNTIFNIKKMRYMIEEKRIIAEKLNDIGLDKLLDEIEIKEIKKNENNKQ